MGAITRRRSTRCQEPRLPPGPRAPRAWQTLAWVAAPAGFLQACAQRHGDVLTLRTHWTDGPLVLVSRPADVARVYGEREALSGAAGAPLLERFAGPFSVLALDGAEHLRQRRLLLGPFHGDAVRGHRALVADLARAGLERWPAEGVVEALPRMQALTLEVIVRVVLGARAGEEADALRGAILDALAPTRSVPQVAAMALVRRELGPRSPWARFRRGVERVDALLYALIADRRRSGGGGAVIDDLLAARHDDGSPPSDREVRDQLVTLLAAGHETTAAALAWGVALLARHPSALRLLRSGEREAVTREVLRTRPVLTVTPRRVVAPFSVGGHELPPGVHVAPCILLAHLRDDVWGDARRFRPERWLESAERPPYAYIPWGGGVRRCAGAAFAEMELREVLAAVAERFDLAPARARPERARRRGVTLAPGHGAQVRVRLAA